MFNDFKPVFKILIRFIVLYVVLVFGYQLYLNLYKLAGLDPFSTWTITQVDFLQNAFGYSSKIVPGELHQETSWFFVEGKYVSRMVEGCNAISVMILFAAFVLAFYQGFKTFLFVIGGIIFLHIINVLRIVGLNILLVEYPQYSKIGHDYLFPAIIYGSVVVLWLVWIKFYALKNIRDESA